MEDGIYLDPNNGNIIASGVLSAARIKLSKPEYAIFGSQNLLEVISAYAPPTDLT